MLKSEESFSILEETGHLKKYCWHIHNTTNAKLVDFFFFMQGLYLNIGRFFSLYLGRFRINNRINWASEASEVSDLTRYIFFVGCMSVCQSSLDVTVFERFWWDLAHIHWSLSRAFLSEGNKGEKVGSLP